MYLQNYFCLSIYFLDYTVTKIILKFLIFKNIIFFKVLKIIYKTVM